MFLVDIKKPNDLGYHFFHDLYLLETCGVEVAYIDHVFHHKVLFYPKFVRRVLVDVLLAQEDHEKSRNILKI